MTQEKVEDTLINILDMIKQLAELTTENARQLQNLADIVGSEWEEKLKKLEEETMRLKKTLEN